MELVSNRAVGHVSHNPEPHEHFAPTGVFVDLPGSGTCFYRQHLNPGKPTLLLLHGMVASSGLNWFRVFPALTDHFNIVAPDLRGHGRSLRGKTRFTINRAVHDMAALLDQLEVGPVIVVGYSMGGAVAQKLWRKYPEKVSGMILTNTAYKARMARMEQRMALPIFATFVGMGRMSELFNHLPRGLIKRFLPVLADQLHEDERRWALDELRRTSLRVILETAREMAFHDASEWLHEIDVPTAVLVSTQDRIIDPEHQEEIASIIKEAKLFHYEGGHAGCTDPAYGEKLALACLNVANRLKKSRRIAHAV
ncbi:MAG: alpha/beta hydrolase [Halioglobus sp.]